ncbi:MAG: helix-turn-helix transcriptional regulator [Peptococcaceae bacterium]|nr:helix-turn-helix transcriptional regulator [Peptococcaceae bacterium]
MKTLPQRLKEIRATQGLSQAELAEKAGLSQPFIGAIEAGKKSPTVRTVEKLAVALGVSIFELLDKPKKEVS